MESIQGTTEESTEIIHKLYKNILENSGKKELKTKKINDKHRCKAAVRYTTIGRAYSAKMIDGIDVYLIDEEKDGNTKTHAYSPCMKTIQGEHGYCHIHFNTFQKNNSSVKNFETDILPKSQNDKTRRIANIDDKYFSPMGKRGAKKKKVETTYTFPDENHPVLLVLNHKDAKLNTILTLYAIQLLKGNPQDIPELKQMITEPIKKVKSSNPFDKLTTTNLVSIVNELKKDDSNTNDLFLEKSDSVSSIDNELEESDEESVYGFNEESDAQCESDIESVNCIPIYTKDKEELWYNPENNMVYRMSGDEGDGTKLGLFKKVDKSNHFIIHEKKHYTIVKENGDGYKCIFSQKTFDEDMNPI